MNKVLMIGSDFDPLELYLTWIDFLFPNFLILKRWSGTEWFYPSVLEWIEDKENEAEAPVQSCATNHPTLMVSGGLWVFRL